MISTAERTKSIQEYYFSKKLAQIRQMNSNGEDVINLGIGSPDLPPSQSVTDRAIEAIRDSSKHGYQPYNGTAELRNAISQWYQKFYSVELDADKEILPLLGSKEGVNYISMAFFKSRR
jgi:aspartate/methionine/tyrosine aminotransferase